MLDRFEAVCGLRHIRALHLNDSKGGVGSHLDRHQHIGEGTIGGGVTPARLKNSGFAAVVCRPEFRSIPKIMETPKGEGPGGVPFDTLNLQRLRKLAPPEQPIKNGRRSSGPARRPKASRGSSTKS